MLVKFILIADAANFSREGKLNIVGEFNAFLPSQVPFVWPQMAIVARLEASLAEGLDHAAQFKLTDADGNSVAQSAIMPIKFASAGAGMPARADAHGSSAPDGDGVSGVELVQRWREAE